jgi:hypothetical protein
MIGKQTDVGKLEKDAGWLGCRAERKDFFGLGGNQFADDA